MSAEVAAQAVPGQDELLDAQALDLIGDLERRFGAAPARAAGGARGARGALRRRRATGLPGGDARAARGRVERGGHAARPRRPPRRDHRPGRRRRWSSTRSTRARASSCAASRTRSRRPGATSSPGMRPCATPPAGRSSSRRPRARATRSASELATLVVRPRGWHLDERHVHVDGRPVSASLFDIALYLRWNGLASLARGSGPYVYLAKLESRHEAELWNDVFIAAQEAVGLPRGIDPRDRPDRDDHRVVRDGGDPVRAARALGGPQRGPLGLHLQRDQEVPRRPGARAAGPRRGDDGGAVHARLHRAARARLPPPRRARDRRHGGVHPEPRRDAVNEQAFARVREDKEREAGQGFDGTWVAHPGPRAARARDLRRGARRAAQPEGAPARGRRCPTRRPCSRSIARRAIDHARRRPDERLGRPALPRLLARRRRRGRDRQPHGGRRHRRDLARAAVAVDPPRLPHERGRDRSRPRSTSASATPCWRDCRRRAPAPRRARRACSTRSCWTATSRPS